MENLIAFAGSLHSSTDSCLSSSLWKVCVHWSTGILGPSQNAAYLSESVQAAQQNTADWAVCKQQKFISHGFGGWNLEIRVGAWLGGDPLLGFRLLFESSYGRRG